ncbi:hypothetical protein ES708_14503 [subsurface metagenome]
MQVSQEPLLLCLMLPGEEGDPGDAQHNHYAGTEAVGEPARGQVAGAVGDVVGGHYPAHLLVVEGEFIPDEGGEGLKNSRGEVMAEVGQNEKGHQPRHHGEIFRFLDITFFLVVIYN